MRATPKTVPMEFYEDDEGCCRVLDELGAACATPDPLSERDRRAQLFFFLRDVREGRISNYAVKAVGGARVRVSEFRISHEPFPEETPGHDGRTHVRIYFHEPVISSGVWNLRAHKKDFKGDVTDDQNRNIALAERRRVNWLYGGTERPHVG